VNHIYIYFLNYHGVIVEVYAALLDADGGIMDDTTISTKKLSAKKGGPTSPHGWEHIWRGPANIQRM
jgi:glycine cleavage system aminomethyltransferase T